MLIRPLRKNRLATIPPDAGGFRVIRACALAVALSMAVLCAMAASPYCTTGGKARAQSSPARSDRMDDLVRQVVTLDSEIDSVNGRIAGLEARSESLERRIESLGPEIEQRKARVSRKRGALAARARSLYVNGRTNNLVVLITSDDVADFFNRKDMLEKVAQRDADMIKSARQEAAALAASRDEMKKSKREIDEAGSQLKSQLKRLEAGRSEKRALIASAGSSADQVVARSGNVESKMDEINRRNPPKTTNPPVSGRPTGRVMTMVATAYCPLEPGLDYNTASGMRAARGVVAVDPRVIPLGTRLHVEGYGNCIAGDTGSAIKGNRIDLCFDTLEEMNAFGGYRTLRVEILD